MRETISTTRYRVSGCVVEHRVLAYWLVVYHASSMQRVYQGLICSDTGTCRHTEPESAAHTCYLRCCLLFVGCLTSQKHASVSQDRPAQTVLRAATLRWKLQAKTFHLTQSQYTDTGPTSPSADPITPGAWQGSHWDANF